MLGKLIKHEFRATGRRMLPTLGVLALLGILANISFRLIEAKLGGVMMEVLGVLFGVTFFVGIIVVWIMTLVMMITRFYRNLLKDEGYLMFTLPTDAHALIWSKLIVSTVWFFAAAVLSGLLIFVTAINLVHMNGVAVQTILEGMGEGLDALAKLGVSRGRLVLLLAELAVAIVIGCLTSCLHFYAAMGLGQMSADHKGLMSVLAFIGISIVFRTIGTTVFGGLVSAGSIDVVAESVEQLIETAPGTLRVMGTGIGGGVLISVLQGAALYVVTALTLKKKLNLA